jgi:hypothetical protein
MNDEFFDCCLFVGDKVANNDNDDDECSSSLESVDLQLLLLNQTHLREELANVFALVSLQLQNLTVLWMFDDSAVACELLQWRINENREREIKEIKFLDQKQDDNDDDEAYLFACSHNLFEVIIRRKPLYSC